MGKSRNSQRTKGNVRPSSSGHSAELLNSDGKLGFIGFGGSKIGQHVAQNSDSSLDGMFSMVMKKLMKRDTVTKLKAIQEFRDLCCERDREQVLEVLAFWPRLYNKLALDNDRRIRELTQEANAKLVEKAKRDIAPYLRSIMGVWLLSQNDPYQPASSSAQSAFNSTFPKEKHSEVLMFCKGEIMMYFKDNLFEQTPESLSEPNIPSEEVKQKYALVICGTFHGLQQFVASINQDAKDLVIEEIVSIVTPNKFWKFAQNENLQIRVAWYNLVSVLCREIPGVFHNLETKLGHRVLGCISESDSVLAPAIWEAALYYVAGFENCWNKLDINKVVVPELMKLLKEGGRGNASLLFPCLLPFLSKFPNDVNKQQELFPLIFSGLGYSLFLESVKASSSECNAIIAAYLESMSFICFQLGKKQEWSSIIEKLISNELFPLLTRSFEAEGAHLASSNFYPLLGTFIQTLENNAFIEGHIMQSVYKKLLALFCEQVLSICQRIIMYPCYHGELDLVAQFIHYMYWPPSISSEKCKYSCGLCDKHMIILAHYSSSGNSGHSPSKRSLFTLVVKLIILLFDKINSKLESHYLKLFVSLLASVPCPELFQELLQVSSSEQHSESEHGLVFYERVIIPWIQRAEHDETLLESIVDIIYAICSCVKTDSALEILNNCCQIDHPEFIKALLKQGMLSYADDKVLHKWLKGNEAGKAVFDLFNLAIHINFPHQKHKLNRTSLTSYFSALLDSLFHPKANRLMLDKKYYENILSTIHETMEAIYEQMGPLQSTDIDVLEFMCCTAQSTFSNCEECWMLPVASSLLKVFLELNLCHKYPFNKNLEDKLSQLWKIGVQRLSVIQYNLKPEKQFVMDVILCFRKLFTHPLEDDICARVFRCLSVMMCELRNTYLSVEETEEAADIKLCYILDMIFPNKQQWDELRKKLKLCVLPAYLEKKLFYPLPKDKIHPFEPQLEPNYTATVKNISNTILKCISSEELAEIKPVLIKLIKKQLIHLLWAFSYSTQNGQWTAKADAIYEDQEECEIQKKCFKILSFFSEVDAITFLSELSEMPMMYSMDWILPAQYAIEMIKMQHSICVSTLYEMYIQLSYDVNDGKQLTSQILIHHLPTSLKTDILLLFSISFCESLNQDQVNLGALAKVCCCAQDNNLLNDTGVQDALLDVILQALDFIRVERLNNSMYVTEMSSQVHCLISQVLKHCPKILMGFFDQILDLASYTLEYFEQKKEIICTESADLIHAYHCSTMICNLLSVVTGDHESCDYNIQLHRPNFMNNITQNLVNLFLDISSLCNKMKVFPQPIANFLATISTSVDFIPPEFVLNSVLPKSIELPQHKVLDITLREKLLPFLTSSVFSIQLGAHSILMKIMPLFPSFLSVDEDKPDDIEKKFNKLKPLIEILESTTHIVESMLSDLKVDQMCCVLPGTDSYIYTMAFLFGWSEILEFFAASTNKERSAYSTYLADKNLLATFLSSLFRLLPENPALCASIRTNNSKDALKSVFLEPPIFSALDQPTAAFVEHVACNTYFCALRRMPAAIRSWGHSIDKKAFEAVNKFTSKYVSNLLAAKELESLQENTQQLAEMTSKNMIVQVCPGSREVIAMYTVDSSTIELVIQLPADFPFGAINIEKRGNVKLSQAKWRQWLMQLVAFLTYQNGSILDGLMLWKKNLDKTFEGVEECLICYFILHSSSLELPQKSCPTCKKKFHASCIHKWFVTSNNTLCPLCRNYW